MGSVIFDMSMSLDGFMAGDNVRLEAGLGDDGQRLHNWAFEDEGGMDRIHREVAKLGAVICGRRTYDLSIPYWGPDGPTAEARVPTVVLTHREPAAVPANGVYTFAPDVATAFAKAREIAGDRNISVMGGAELGRQAIRAGEVDEISVHLVPVLFGSGIRMFDDVTDEHITLETLDVDRSPSAVHLRYRVVRG